jgi:muconolactone delta-isomerase
MCASNNVKPVDVVDDPLVQSWLNEFSKPSTRRNYMYGIRIFFGAVGLSPTEFVALPQREIKQIVLGFQRKLKDEGVADGKISLSTITVRSFLTSQDVVVKFRRNQLVVGGADKSSHVFSNGDLNRLWSVGGAFEKALLACACSQGWEVSMFIAQSRDKIQRRIEHAEQNGVKFVFFMDKRDKTGAERLCVLNPLAIECLKNYFAVRTDTDPRLFPITQDGVQKMLYRLAKDANLKTTGALRFHNIRKWLMSRLSRCNFNEFQIKFVMGKSIGLSDGVYLQTLQSEIEEKYPTVYNDYLNICWKPGSVSGQSVFSADDIKELKALLAAYRSGKLKWVE